MNQERRQILDMLSEKTISVGDAEKLMDKLNDRQTTTLVPENGNGIQPRYLRVEVHDDNDNVSIQIPMALMRPVSNWVPCCRTAPTRISPTRASTLTN